MLGVPGTRVCRSLALPRRRVPPQRPEERPHFRRQRVRLLLGTVGAAVDIPALLDPVPDDAYAAVRAGGSQGVDRAPEAVEGVGLALQRDLERLVVVVAANL